MATAIPRTGLKRMRLTCMLSCFSCLCLFSTPWTVAHQVPLSMGFFRQEYWSGVPFPPPGDLPGPKIKPRSLMSPALADRFFAIVYNIFVGIKIIVACSAHVCKWATEIISKEVLQIHIGIFHSESMVPHVSMEKLQKMDLYLNPIKMEWYSDTWGCISTSLQERAHSRKPLFLSLWQSYIVTNF